MKRFILTETQLKTYIENKKSEKVFYNILENLHKNQKFLNENISHAKANQSVVDGFKCNNLITPKVYELLIEHKIMNENYEII